ncbi:MAG: response regulator [Candidatus Alcyoniella australis]|nr:response regulator [Candidatus Alcyoniella australis]
MDQPKRILVVDDDEMNRRLLTTILGRLGYEVDEAFDGINALERVAANPPEVILLDIDMPRMNGFEVARRLKDSDETKIIPIVAISSSSEVESRIKAFEVGADDFLSKPVDQTELRARVQSLLKVKAYNDHMLSHQLILEREVEKRTEQLRTAYEDLKSASLKIKQGTLDTIFRLAQAAEYKDMETGSHIKRIGYYAAAVSRSMSLPAQDVDTVLYAAPMHDIGKIGIPDRILLKRASLDSDEWEVMKQHTLIGGKILSGSDTAVLKMAEQIALTHHEKWDGSGYPKGLKGDQIPLWGRITSVADVFDALTSDRPYKQAIPIDESIEIMKKGRGVYFDPDVTDTFFSIMDQIATIRTECVDEPAQPITESQSN